MKWKSNNTSYPGYSIHSIWYWIPISFPSQYCHRDRNRCALYHYRGACACHRRWVLCYCRRWSPNAPNTNTDDLDWVWCCPLDRWIMTVYRRRPDSWPAVCSADLPFRFRGQCCWPGHCRQHRCYHCDRVQLFGRPLARLAKPVTGCFPQMHGMAHAHTHKRISHGSSSGGGFCFFFV